MSVKILVGDMLGAEVEKRERALERLKTSGKNFLGESLKRNIAGLKADILKAEEHIRQGDELLALLKDYSYQCDVWTPDQMTSTFAFKNTFHGMFNQRYEGG